MLRPRVIPCLLIQDGSLVKTRRFKEPKYVGDPINAVRIFNQKEVDELFVLDIDASKKSSPPNFALLSTLASECFMPLGYIGGIKTLEHAKKLLSLGIEKIGVNTSSFENLDLINQISSHAGKQAVLCCIDVKKSLLGGYKLFSHAKSKNTVKSIDGHILDCIEAGCGEILLQSVDQDGMQQGFDLDLIKMVAPKINVPLIALGGAGKLDDITDCLKAGANAAAAGSLFTFYGKHRAVLITYPKSEELKILYNTLANS